MSQFSAFICLLLLLLLRPPPTRHSAGPRWHSRLAALCCLSTGPSRCGGAGGVHGEHLRPRCDGLPVPGCRSQGQASVLEPAAASNCCFCVTSRLLQTMRVKLQPPSGTRLRAYNPLLPPAAISQLLLLANPEEVSLLLLGWSSLGGACPFTSVLLHFRPACVSATS